MAIKVEVSTGGHPIWIRLLDEHGDVLQIIPHSELLQLEHAVAEARRRVLCALDRRNWHEVDPKLAGA